MDRGALVTRLERFVEFPGTLPLFDVLSLPEGPEMTALVAVVIGRFPTHPLAADVRRWLAANGVDAPPPDPLAVLAELGISDVRVWAERQKREVVTLQRALEDARESRMRAAVAANGYSLVSVLLLGVALLGWAAAFHLWSFSPEGPLPGPNSASPNAVPVAPVGK